MSLTQISASNQGLENGTVIQEGNFLDSIIKSSMIDVDDLQVGDVVVAKVDVPSLRIWSGSGYEITAMYFKGANPDTGMVEQIPVTKFNDEIAKLGYKKYLEVYNPRDHRENGPMIVSPEEMGLVTLKSELKEAMLLAIPGFFWVFVAAAFVNWYSSQYGGNFWDAMFPHRDYTHQLPSTNALPNLLFFMTMLLLPFPNNAFLTSSPHSSMTMAQARRELTMRSSSGMDADGDKFEPIVVAMTREDGKNGQLLQEISQDDTLSRQLEMVELPCIAHAAGPDYNELPATLLSKRWDYVAVTSPEAANVLASAWDVVRDNPLPVVAVGKATEKALEKYCIPVTFTASKATAVVMAKELDLVSGEGTTVLYPASARAKTTLQDGLSDRGFDVTRLNTYDTVTATWTQSQIELSQKVKVACFASPSSIKGWLENSGNNKGVYAACIGETSATACREHGWKDSHIFFPDAPGMEGWVHAIRDAMNASHKALV
jgi:uroporphyrinogen-III synthase